MFYPLCPECFDKPTAETRQCEVVSWPPHALDTDRHTFDCEDEQYERGCPKDRTLIAVYRTADFRVVGWWVLLA